MEAMQIESRAIQAAQTRARLRCPGFQLLCDGRTKSFMGSRDIRFVSACTGMDGHGEAGLSVQLAFALGSTGLKP